MKFKFWNAIFCPYKYKNWINTPSTIKNYWAHRLPHVDIFIRKKCIITHFSQTLVNIPLPWNSMECPQNLCKEYLYHYTINDQSMFLISCAKKHTKICLTIISTNPTWLTGKEDSTTWRKKRWQEQVTFKEEWIFTASASTTNLAFSSSGFPPGQVSGLILGISNKPSKKHPLHQRG